LTYSLTIDLFLYYWLIPLLLTYSFTIDSFLYYWLIPLLLTYSFTIDSFLYYWLIPLLLTYSFTIDLFPYYLTLRMKYSKKRTHCYPSYDNQHRSSIFSGHAISIFTFLPLKLSVRTPFIARCTRCNIMW
jgi:hypothetical protein